MNDNGSPYPDELNAEDVAYSLVQSVVGAVPGLGVFFSEVVKEWWIPKLQRRQEAWFNDLARRLGELDLDVEELNRKLEDDNFIEIALEAARIVSRSRDDEKLEALRNAVLNTALEVEEDHAWRLIFMSRLADLQVAHITQLRVLEGSVNQPAWDPAFYQQILRDLEQMGFKEPSSQTGFSTSPSIEFRWGISDLGKRFLKFISESPTTS